MRDVCHILWELCHVERARACMCVCVEDVVINVRVQYVRVCECVLVYNRHT